MSVAMSCRLRRLALFALLAGGLSQAVGCHELQQHRRARWNYGPPMSSGTDAYGGVVDTSAVEGLG